MVRECSEQDLIDFVLGNREPLDISEAANQLVFLTSKGAMWPPATAQHWKREFEQLVSKGLLELKDGRLWAAREESLQQQQLFDL